METSPGFSRRPIPARSSGWARRIAAGLARAGVSPNSISAASVVFALLTAGSTLLATRSAGWLAVGWYLVAAAAIGLRLLANLFDGMVAIEGGRRSPSGEVWNELPDRLSDAIVLVTAGIALGTRLGATLGWSAALVAVFVAYVRALGTSVGLPADFRGPMAKQQRMATLALGLVAAAVEVVLGAPARAIPVALALVVAGGVVTALHRTLGIVRGLEAR